MTGYLPALSGLRAVACLAVVLFHAKVSWGSGGFLGVDMFFVLSGYLTVSILARHDRQFQWVDIASFMEKRIRRIVPLLIAVGLAVGLVLSLSTDIRVGEELLPTFGLFSNFVISAGGGPDYLGHSWSLAAEMQFYLLVALMFMAVGAGRHVVLFTIFAFIFAAVTALRFAAFSDGWTWSSIYFSPVLRLSGLFLGGAIALVPMRVVRWMAPFGWPAFFVSLYGLSNAVHLSAISFTIWSTTVEVATAVVILSLVARPTSSLSAVLSGRRIEVLGLWSFGIYLWHYPVARVLRDLTTPEATAALTLLISVPLAAFTYTYVEERYRRSRFNAAGAVTASS